MHFILIFRIEMEVTTLHFIVNHGGGSWAMTCADVDQNGWKDVALMAALEIWW